MCGQRLPSPASLGGAQCRFCSTTAITRTLLPLRSYSLSHELRRYELQYLMNNTFASRLLPAHLSPC